VQRQDNNSLVGIGMFLVRRQMPSWQSTYTCNTHVWAYIVWQSPAGMYNGKGTWGDSPNNSAFALHVIPLAGLLESYTTGRTPTVDNLVALHALWRTSTDTW